MLGLVFVRVNRYRRPQRQDRDGEADRLEPLRRDPLRHEVVEDRLGAALAEAGISLQGMDFSEPAAGDPLPADGVIHVTRVREDVVLAQTVGYPAR